MLPRALPPPPLLGAPGGLSGVLKSRPVPCPMDSRATSPELGPCAVCQGDPWGRNHLTSSPFAGKARGGSVSTGRWGCGRFPRSSV